MSASQIQQRADPTELGSLRAARLEALFERSGDGIMVFSGDGELLLANPMACTLFGLREGTTGIRVEDLVPTDRRVAHAAHFAGFRDGHDDARPMQRREIVHGLAADGREIALEVTLARIDVGGHRELVAYVRDASERARLIEGLRIAATTDALTGIANRRLIEQALMQELARGARYGHATAVLMIDIDHFKRVNDTHGHAVGDAVLRGLAGEVQACLRGNDVVGRWGGEELLVVLPEADRGAATQCAERIRARIAGWSHPLAVDAAVHVTVSVGVAIAASGCTSPEAVVAAADAAMYAAKRAGRDRVEVHTGDVR
jgi:diguanylate cyclase (GGDEF)-like protein/PAS domain S-box-containing protein